MAANHLVCPNCGGTTHRWFVSCRGPNDVQDGRIRLSEISAIAYLGCEECSETLKIIDSEEIEERLNLD